MKDDVIMLSLYDYLHRPAGYDEGTRVYQESKKRGVESQLREISNPKFTGDVRLYPKWFLDDYYHNADPKDNISAFTSTDDDDDLPF